MLSRIQYWQLLSTYYAPGSVQDLEYKSQQNPLCLQGSQSHIQEGHFLKWRKIHLRHTHTHTCRLTHSGQPPECDHCPLDILIFKKKPAHHKHRRSPWRSERVVLLLCFVTAGSDLSSVDPCMYPVPCLPLSAQQWPHMGLHSASPDASNPGLWEVSLFWAHLSTLQTPFSASFPYPEGKLCHHPLAHPGR